jgi:hypothetical protein
MTASAAGPAVQRLTALAVDPPGPTAPRPSARHAMTLVAAGLAVALVATLTGARLLAAHHPGSGAPATAGAAGDCRLPVVVTAAGYPPTTLRAGFVDLATGVFQADAAAPAGSVTYDRAVGGWVPVRASAIAPDGSGYTYVRPGSATFELHVVDARTKADRIIWTGPGGVGFPVEWQSDGIHVTTTPEGGGRTQGWLVSPSGGEPRADAVLPITAEFARTNVGTFFTRLSFEETFKGQSIVRDKTAGVELVGSEGQTTPIHALTTDFDPTTFVADGDRLWAVNADGGAIWLWTEKDGLQRLPIQGSRPTGVTYWAAGRCVGAPTASPSAPV